MPTYIHGIGASENIDSSGEIVSIQGLDISSLDKDGVFNYEHKSDQPSQIVGKILKARKIFTDKDCEDDYQKHFWDKCRVPYLYVMGELLDDYSDSAREVAGKFRYDADHAGKNERAIMNFSVEGAKIAKEGITVTRSIARKITLTVLPCNKAAVAEMVSVDQPKAKKSEIDELFKTETIEIEVLRPDESSKLWDMIKREVPSAHAAKIGVSPMKKDYGGGAISNTASTALSGTGPTSAGGLMVDSEKEKTDLKKAKPHLKIAGAPEAAHARGKQIGMTSGGHGVFSHGMVGDYGHFGHKEHAEASAAHQKVSDATNDPKLKMHHSNKARLHAAASRTAEARTRSNAERTAKLATTASTAKPNIGTSQKLHHPDISGKMKPPGPTEKSEGVGQKSLTQPEPRMAPSAQGVATQSHGEVKRAQPKPLLPKSEDMAKYDTLSPSSNSKSPRNHRVEKDPAKHDLFQGGHHMPRNPTAVAQNMNSFSRIHNETNKVSQTGATKISGKKDSMVKALTAGSGLAAPDRLAQGAVLGKESLEKDSKDPNWVPKDKKISNLQRQVDAGTYKPDPKKIAGAMLQHPEKPLKGTKVQKAEKGVHIAPDAAKPGNSFAGNITRTKKPEYREALKVGHKAVLSTLQSMPKPNLPKSEMLQRAEADYMSWNKREQFETFMKSRMPNLTKSEIKVIGMTMLLQKSARQEKLLKDFYNPSGGSALGKAQKPVHPKDPVLGPSAQEKPATEEYKKKALAYINKPKNK